LGAAPGSRVLIVGTDADVSATLHLALERAGHLVHCAPGPSDLDSALPVVRPHMVVMLLPASPDTAWGNALSTASSAAKVGVRVVLISPAREVVEPLAALAGAERALARSEVMTRPMIILEKGPSGSSPTGPGGAIVPPAPPPRDPTPPPIRTSPPAPANPIPLVDLASGSHPIARLSKPNVDLMAMIDEELVDEPAQRPQVTRVEVAVSLVSEHNFYVGSTKRIDSGGVFIATMLPPAIGTHLQIRLGLADGRKLDLEGDVVFVREKAAMMGRQPAGCGVKLASLPGWAVEAIDRFLQARQPIVFVPR
jgi:Tfp pilus assembly protein PilZ